MKVALLGALLLSGCTAVPSQHAASVKEADAIQVANCNLLGTVFGKSLIGGVVSTGANNAMVDAREKAAAMGATHIVFSFVDGGGMHSTGSATAKAYACR